MIEFEIPGRGHYALKNLVLDLNGTIALDGHVIPGVEEKIEALRNSLSITILTADTHGLAAEVGKDLNIAVHKLTPGNEPEQKLDFIRQLGSEYTVCIGNGANDAYMLQEAALGICVLGPEGTAFEAVTNADVVARDIQTALDMLIHPLRLIATLRK